MSPIYQGKCPHCTRFNQQFLKLDIESTVIECHGCGRRTAVKQLRDNSKVVTKDGVTGVLRDGD